MSTDPCVGGGDNSCDPCSKTHGLSSKSYPVLHYETLRRGRRQTMETELVRIYTERITAQETTVPGVSTLDGTVKELSETPFVQLSQ